MASENVFLLHALLMGIFITFVYDFLRILRRVIPHNSFFVSLEDLGFWIYCGAEVFLLMYHESNGTLRWFAVFGALAGMTAYKKLVSPLFVKYVSMLLGRLLKTVLKPLAFLGRKTGQGVRRTGSGIQRIAARIRRRIKNRLTSFLKLLKINLRVHRE